MEEPSGHHLHGLPQKTYQTQYPQQPEALNRDLVMSQKLDLLSSLITNEILLQRAEKLGLTAVDADVDTEINKIKAPFTKEGFERQLADRHMTIGDLRAQIRQRLTVEKLVNKEITSQVNITDADVANFYNSCHVQRTKLLAQRLNCISERIAAPATSRSTRCGPRYARSWPAFPCTGRTSAGAKFPIGTGISSAAPPRRRNAEPGR